MHYALFSFLFNLVEIKAQPLSETLTFFNNERPCSERREREGIYFIIQKKCASEAKIHISPQDILGAPLVPATPNAIITRGAKK